MIEAVLYRLILIVVVCLMFFFAGLGFGVHHTETRFKEERIELIQKSRATEQSLIQQQDEVVREYTGKIRDMEERYAQDMEELRNSQLRDTVPVPVYIHDRMQSDTPCVPDAGLPQKTTNKSGITCYTEKQLRAKIEDSLAIARECDREMIRFQALIKACSDNQGK